MLSNAIRGHMAELGVISAKGRNGTAELLKIIANETNDCIPAAAQFSLDVLARQYAATTAEIGVIEKRIHAWHRSCEESRRLEEIPGIGPIAAAMQHQARLLLFRFHGYKTHRRPRYRLADCGSVIGVVLAALEVGLHITWRHQPYRVAERLFDTNIS